jgi:phage terminase small subunit
MTDVPEEVSPDGIIHADGDGPVDVLRLFQGNAIWALRENEEFQRSIDTQRGIPWGTVVGILAEALPATMQDDRRQVANGMVEEALNQILGKKGQAWETVRRDTSKKKNMLFIVRK